MKVQGHPRMKCEEVDGHPVSVWDDGSKVNDRYTLVLMEPFAHPAHYNAAYVMYYGMNGTPFSPNCGVAQTGEMPLVSVGYKGRGGAFTKRIKFSDLPQDCQKAGLQWLRSE